MHAYPEAQDVGLIIEVAATSIEYDEKFKSKLYAEAGIPEYWIVNTENNEILMLSLPAQGEYTDKVRLESRDPLTIGFLNKTVPAKDLLA